MVALATALLLGEAFAMDAAELGKEHAKAVSVDLKVVAVGAAAGCCPTPFLGAAVGAGACLVTTGAFAVIGAPEADHLSANQAYQDAYQKELRKRRAMWALAGGTAGLMAGVAINIALSTMVLY